MEMLFVLLVLRKARCEVRDRHRRVSVEPVSRPRHVQRPRGVLRVHVRRRLDVKSVRRERGRVRVEPLRARDMPGRDRRLQVRYGAWWRWWKRITASLVKQETCLWKRACVLYAKVEHVAKTRFVRIRDKGVCACMCVR